MALLGVGPAAIGEVAYDLYRALPQSAKEEVYGYIKSLGGGLVNNTPKVVEYIQKLKKRSGPEDMINSLTPEDKTCIQSIGAETKAMRRKRAEEGQDNIYRPWFTITEVRRISSRHDREDVCADVLFKKFPETTDEFHEAFTELITTMKELMNIRNKGFIVFKLYSSDSKDDLRVSATPADQFNSHVILQEMMNAMIHEGAEYTFIDNAAVNMKHFTSVFS